MLFRSYGASGGDAVHSQTPQPAQSFDSLVEVVRKSMEAQQVQAEKQKHRWKAMKHQFHQLQEEVHARDARVSATEVRLGPDRLEEGDSVEDVVQGRWEAKGATSLWTVWSRHPHPLAMVSTSSKNQGFRS